MSIHPSLRGINTLVGERSVFTRRERIEKLMRDGKLNAEASAYGLPKVRTVFKLKSKRVVKEAAAAAPKAGAKEVAKDATKDAKKDAKKGK